MKFYLPEGKLTQFSTISVKCHDNIMTILIHILMDLNRSACNSFAIDRQSGRNAFMFKSGAALIINTQKNFFGIWCYHYAGEDGLSAIEELKMAYHIYRAQQHAYKTRRIIAGPVIPIKIHQLDVKYNTLGE